MTRRSFLLLSVAQYKQQDQKSSSSVLINIDYEHLQLNYKSNPISLSYFDKSNKLVGKIEFTLQEIYKIVQTLRGMINPKVEESKQ